jgi:uncharacterized protein
VSKLLLFALAAVIVYFVLRSRRPRADAPAERRPVERMVACASCGMHVPRSEAVEATGVYFCSEEHRVRGAG